MNEQINECAYWLSCLLIYYLLLMFMQDLHVSPDELREWICTDDEYSRLLISANETDSKLIVCTTYTVWVKKYPPWGFLAFFPKRLGIFYQFFTHLLCVPIYAR